MPLRAQARGAVDRLLTKEQWQQTEADEGQKAGTVALVRCSGRNAGVGCLPRHGSKPGTLDRTRRWGPFCTAGLAPVAKVLTICLSARLTGCSLQGIANLVGVTWLSSLLQDASIKYALANSSLGFVAAGMPFLQVPFCCNTSSHSRI